MCFNTLYSSYTSLYDNNLYSFNSSYMQIIYSGNKSLQDNEFTVVIDPNMDLTKPNTNIYV